MAELSPLRRRMIEDMTVRNPSPATQRSYINAVQKFSRYFARSPDRLDLDDVHAFQVHLVSTGISWASLNQIVCALRFFYGITLSQNDVPERIPYARKPRTLPVVLSLSPTAASSKLMTTMLPFDGRIIGAMDVIARRSCAFILTSSSDGFSCTRFPPASTACVTSAVSPTVIDGIASLCAGCSLGSHRQTASNPISPDRRTPSPTNAPTAKDPCAGLAPRLRRLPRRDRHPPGATHHDAQQAVLLKSQQQARAFIQRWISRAPTLPNERKQQSIQQKFRTTPPPERP